jgi:hypothetical protein
MTMTLDSNPPEGQWQYGGDGDLYPDLSWTNRPDMTGSKGLHRIRHYGLLANVNRAANIAKARELLAVPPLSNEPDTAKAAEADQPCALPRPCPCCGGRMFIIETFAPGREPKYRPNATPPMLRIDTS